MSIAERYRECARVIDMCEGTEVHPWKCIKYMSNDWRMENRLDLDRQGDYDFAVAILEGKPVFVGDKFYSKKDGCAACITRTILLPADMSHFTWNKPEKRTFALAGGVLPMPISNEQNAPRMRVGGEFYYFYTDSE